MCRQQKTVQGAATPLSAYFPRRRSWNLLRSYAPSPRCSIQLCQCDHVSESASNYPICSYCYATTCPARVCSHTARAGMDHEHSDDQGIPVHAAKCTFSRWLHLHCMGRLTTLSKFPTLCCALVTASWAACHTSSSALHGVPMSLLERLQHRG